MLEELVSPQVACVETFEDQAIELFPEERAAVGGAVERRRLEFTTARWCARGALARLGLPPVPIVPQLSGEPRWPPGVVGSITHCAGYRASSVARRREFLTLGIDAEPNQPLPDGVLDAIALPEERAVTVRLGGYNGVCWDRLLFSTKESVYKAWYPVARRFLDFSGATVRIDTERGTFSARILTSPARAGGVKLATFAGRWVARQGLLVTAITVANPQAAASELAPGPAASSRSRETTVVGGR